MFPSIYGFTAALKAVKHQTKMRKKKKKEDSLKKKPDLKTLVISQRLEPAWPPPRPAVLRLRA
jgi:hypothetical protein